MTDIDEVQKLERELSLEPEKLQPDALDAKTANILYHDWEAQTYDEKWSISFDERCVAYVRDKFCKVAPERRYGKVLEVGAGTGFFIINLAQAGLVNQPYATDISPKMVDVCVRNARDVGVKNMVARTADAEQLPFEDATFDLVVGHAFLHHLPDVEAFFAEAFRVLRPGGGLVIAGEPTRLGFQVVEAAKRSTAWVVNQVASRLGLLRPRAGGSPEAALQAHVDLHEFHPHMVQGWARAAGFGRTKIVTDEFVSGIFGWSMRTVEALAREDLVGDRWRWFAYRNYLRLYKLDDLLLRRVVPKELFYNLLMYAEKPKV